jgi:hypothetical protein
MLYMGVAAELSPERVKIEFRRSFLEAYKNRVTIETRFTVDASAASPNPSVFDGDLHFAGRAPEIGLRLVAEIKNAAEFEGAVALARGAASTGRQLQLTGVWRFWPEHSLGASEQQGRPIQQLESPYPDHVFEVHPVTRIGSLGLVQSLHVLDGYKPGSAKRTLESYQDAKCRLTVTPTTVTFETPTWLYNDVHFVMEITGTTQMVVSDGRFVTASAREPDGTLLVEGLRMVFVGGSSAERAVRSLARGARLHVWGLPRLNFAELSRRVAESGSNPALLEGPMPYEIVVIGVYPEGKVLLQHQPAAPLAARP